MSTPRDPDEPTQFYPPGHEPEWTVDDPGGGYLGPADEGPTEFLPGAAPLFEPTGVAGPIVPVRRVTNPWMLAVVAVFVALLVALVVLLLVAAKPHKAVTSAPSGLTTTVPSTLPDTSTTPTAPGATLPPLPTNTSAPAPSTTSTGNRMPTAAEQAAIQRADNPGPNGVIDLIRVSNSDPTWAVDHVTGAPGHSNDVQPVYHLLHRGGSSWSVVSEGTAQVDCSPNVPASVVSDFADILGSCPPGGGGPVTATTSTPTSAPARTTTTTPATTTSTPATTTSTTG